MFSSSRVRSRGTLESESARSASAWRPESLDGVEPDTAELDGVVGPVDAGAEVGADAGPDPEAEARALQAQIDDAYQRGYEAGREAGCEEESARIDPAVRAVEDVVEAFRREAPRWEKALEQNLVALATAVAREVIGRELQGRAEDITALVRQAIEEFPLKAAVRVRLNPADLTAISSPLGSGAVESGRQVRWIPDPEVAPGGCMVEGPESIVDGRVEKALDRIYTRLIYG